VIERIATAFCCAKGTGEPWFDCISFCSVLAAPPSSMVRSPEIGPPDATIGRGLWRKQGNVGVAPASIAIVHPGAQREKSLFRPAEKTYPAISHRRRI
jgi:hypothetical protein